ncbi:MAG TPA: UDP-N-acetylglucosamine--N-acetylmuramyl-(pentapeptide) pyrophosphoryl-undecaprenol N-acetylglucosamine transferase [Candidatus Paceibacterota bacterium]|nr:UDP-N-acetylglucosamine--N-acetylmuramyl-(pentapeptide) pyrophosphoryl-undecaprenol N-acetylglucosamine transferase [Candidatus Paceibacterota bacterium]
MKILFTGGGTGGHFFPIIAVVEGLERISDREHIVGLDLYYMSDDPYDKETLFKHKLRYIEVKTGKIRTYASKENFFDKFRIIGACVVALWKMFVIFPDVVFGKGGYASFPAVFAARILRIPVVIHESDIVPGRVNKWIAPYATKIAISYPETAKYLPLKARDRAALTGQPVRASMLEEPTEDPIAALGLEPDLPVILVIGGSLGAENINENLIDIMPDLVQRYQIIHQTGENNYEWMKKRAEGVLAKNPLAGRYNPYPFLDSRTLRLAAKACDLVVSRAGSAIFEIAHWRRPSIIIPLSIAHGDHQRENAYSYARTGAATVIEEQNLRPTLFLSVIDKLMQDTALRQKMAESTSTFAVTDAGDKIAQALINIGLRHEHE